VQQALGLHNVSGAVLLSDGYEANVAVENMLPIGEMVFYLGSCPPLDAT
jgi:hypothetical protein